MRRIIAMALIGGLMFLLMAAVHTMEFNDMVASQKMQLTAEQRHAVIARMERD